MPTYEFRCPQGHDFEKFYRTISAASAATDVPCPQCGQVAERRMSAGAGLLFKGSGFYITDYGKDGKKDQRAAKAGESGGDKAATPAADGAGAKGDAPAAPAAKSESGATSTPSPASTSGTAGGGTAASGTSGSASTGATGGKSGGSSAGGTT